MEPADLTSRANSEPDPLETLLRRPLAPLPDDGFSRHVVARLPAPFASKRSFPFRLLVIVGSAVAGLALFAVRSDSVTGLERDWASLENAFVQAGAAMNQTSAWVALAAATGSLLYTFYFATPRRR